MQPNISNDAKVQGYVERFLSLGLDGGACSADEVERLDRAAAHRLPAAYKAYLLIAGAEPPAAWVGSDCTVRHLPGLKEAADELLKSDGQPPLSQQAFVFFMHQGYQFFYFIADGTSDDPPVFYYLEREPGVVKKFDRFSRMVAECAVAFRSWCHAPAVPPPHDPPAVG